MVDRWSPDQGCQHGRTTWYMVQRSKFPTPRCHSVSQRACLTSGGGLRVICAISIGHLKWSPLKPDLQDRTKPLTDMDGRLRQALSAGEMVLSSLILVNGRVDRICLILQGNPPSTAPIAAQDTWVEAMEFRNPSDQRPQGSWWEGK